MPPGSPAGAMLPVAHGCLDAGHEVMLIAYDAYAEKFRGLAPRAEFVGLGPLQRPEMDDGKAAFIFGIPDPVMPFVATAGLLVGLDVLLGGPLAAAALPEVLRLRPDVLCTTILPAVYLLGERTGVPVVGLAFGPLSWMTVLDVPWSLEPTIGSKHSREEIARSPLLMVHNTAARIAGVFFRGVGLLAHNVRRWRLGLAGFQADQYEHLLASPMVVPSLPELGAGFPAVAHPNAVMAGMYDHPALEGASFAQSEQHAQILAWLDAQHANGTHVLYVAFGSELLLDRGRIDRLLAAFAAERLTVLWALKKPPADVQGSERVRITPWSPQKAVLAHPAVKAFLSHGGANSAREALAAGTPMLLMPVMPDGGTVVMVHERLGVALRLHKDSITPAAIGGGFRRLCGADFQERASQIRALNDRRADLGRAVEVVEGAASGMFLASTRRGPGPAPWAVAAALLLVALTFAAALACCRRTCGCCARCLCRGSGAPGIGKPKRE